MYMYIRVCIMFRCEVGARPLQIEARGIVGVECAVHF